MPAFPTPALDLILNRADRSAAGRLALSGSRVVASPASGSATYRIVRADTGRASVRACRPNLSGERAFDDVDLSTSTVRIALGIPGSNPFCLATLDTPFPAAAYVPSTPQSATADLPATKRITLDPASYAGSWLLTLDGLDPIELPFDAEAGEIFARAGTNYRVRKVAANAWEISGTEPNQDISIAVDVTGLLVPVGVTGDIELNTQGLADYFTAQGNPRWLRLTLEVDIDGVKVYQNDQIEIARELLNLTTLVPTPIPPSDFATLSAQIAGKQPINSGLTAIAALGTTAWGRALLALTDAGALSTYASLQPLSAQLIAIAALAGAAYGRGLLTQSNSAALRTYIEATFANLPDKPNSIAGYGIGDYNSLGDARWSPLSHAARHAANGADPLTLDQSQITNLPGDLAAKAALASPALSGTPTAPTAANATSSTQLATTAFVHALFTDLLNASPSTLDTLKELADAIGDDPNFAVTVANSVADKLAKALNLSDLSDAAAARGNLGLGNVNNTTDANKPVSIAQAAADLIISNALATHAARSDNPHAVTKAQVGLPNADNTSDAAKPVSAAQQTALDTKAALGANNTFTGQNIFQLLQTFNSIVTSSIVSNQLANPAAPTVTPIGNDEGGIWSYKIVAKLSDGTPSAAGPAGSTANGDKTLDATNKMSLTWPAIPGATSYDVYRTEVSVSPSTTGKIATVNTNAYVDTGAAGDGSTPPVANNTGRVFGRLFDAGGQSHSIIAHGGVGDGVTDNTAAFYAATTAMEAEGHEGELVFPEGDFSFDGDISIAGGKSIKGSNRYGTVLLFKNGGSLILGTSGNPYTGKISDLTIARASAFPPPENSVGIKAQHYDFCLIDNVFIATHDIGIKTGNGTTTYPLGLKIRNTTIFNCGLVDLWLDDAIDTALIDTDFGRGGSGNSVTKAFVLFSGVTDTVTMIRATLIGTPASVFRWENYTATNGIFHFSHLNTEGSDKILSSDAATPNIDQLIITHSRLTCSTKFADFNAATSLTALDISHNPQIRFLDDTTFSNIYRSNFSHNVVSGGLLLNGLGTDSLTFIGNTIQTTIVLSGHWNGLVSIGNRMQYDNSFDVGYLLSATGIVTSVGNTKDAGVQPATILPNQTDWANFTLGSWSNFGSGHATAQYRRDGLGFVHVRGVVTGGTNTPGTVITNLPSGFRPAADQHFPVAGASTIGSLAISSDGHVAIDIPTSSNAFLDFGEIIFQAA